ncbi:hypothetical protein FRC09_005456 [Ceratobasidium sp. 395]|nr:hypothetical protein FRC09_005456 [Ceratobasidium sp. 395]
MSLASSITTKVGGYDFYHQILKSPKYIVAPMVDQSELAWRILSRRHDAQLVYTPMINAKLFAEDTRRGYREQNFNTTFGEEGGSRDRPLIIQLFKITAMRLTSILDVRKTLRGEVGMGRIFKTTGIWFITLGLADWEQIAAVKRAVKIPVFANGNILYPEDVAACLAATGADGVMSAEGNLYNPALFAGLTSESSLTMGPRDHTAMALEYLDIVRSLKTETAPSAVKGHLFKLLRPALAQETDLRDRLGKVMQKGTGRGKGVRDREWVDDYAQIVREIQERMERDKAASTVDEQPHGKPMAHWFAQPYVRPLPALPPNRPATDAKAKPTGNLAANLPPADPASGSSECVECPSSDVAELEKAEAEVALDGASSSGAKRAATPSESTELKRPRLEDQEAAVTSV